MENATENILNMGSIKEKQCIKLHIVLRKRLEALLILGRGCTPQGLNKATFKLALGKYALHKVTLLTPTLLQL